ncbi:2-hydroxyacid dehydrogenase [Geitlerinema sp. PCC 9228]|jgi:D-lactate dehydrogenase|uniref:2-hydroxyacid dehydrogenase n=1 Tax=Geitlerinema sp. PCC 9228 TaxID=111611 RepID=UPI0008F9C50E|nr:2-hydroxyacid dehydrogenase [Geitlerinema sp. PCC 9228]
MKLAVFSTKSYDRAFLEAANQNYHHEITFLEPSLNPETVPLAYGYPAVCAFVHDNVNAEALRKLAEGGTQVIALRCAGFNNVDLQTAKEMGQTVVRVPAYSPHAVAEYTVGLAIALNRKIHRAYNRVRESNFSLNGLLGFDFHQRTVGIVGTGKIGAIVARIFQGFGCKLLAYDLYPNPECKEMGVEYVSLEEIFSRSHVISLHCPLTPDTYHLINPETVSRMQDGVMLINTSRGGLIDTQAVIDGLKSGKIGSLGLDVYEQEEDLFFEDLSEIVIQDDTFERLLTFPNVLITGHQAFFTREALTKIAETTLSNISQVEKGEECPNEVSVERIQTKK